MQNLIISPSTVAKLREKHSVSPREVEQCFDNRCGLYLVDDREDHQTDPATLWFIAPTNQERSLKVIFMFIDGNVHVKSAYEPEPIALEIYQAMGK